MRTLLIDNYDSYTYNLFQVIAEVNGELPLVYCNDKITLEQIQAMVHAGTVHSIVISPGPGTPNNPQDIGVCLDVLQHLPDVPILGICLGHQALALAHGARVVAAPEPVHGRVSRLQHDGHPLFADVPCGPGFEVVRYHSLLVEEASLPDCLQPVCWTAGGHAAVKLARDTGAAGGSAMAKAADAGEEDAGEEIGAQQEQGPGRQQQQVEEQQAEEGGYAGGPAGGGCSLLMGLAHRSRPHYGVQFHPESVATRFGIALLRNFRDLAAAHLRARAGPGAAQLPPSRDVADIVGPPGRLPELAPWPSPEHQRGAPLRLAWVRLRGVLGALGGSQGLFELLYGWATDTFWLDSAAADRGRFSYMGGRGGPLWRKLTYKLPLPPLASSSPLPPLSPSQQQHSLPNPQQQQHEPTVDQQQHDQDSDAASATSSTSTADASTASGTAASSCATAGAGTRSSAACGAPPHHHSRHATPAGSLTLETADGASTTAAAPGGLLTHLQRLLSTQRVRVDPDAAAALPFNFWGGLVGYLGYELKAECGATNTHAASTPDAVLWLADRMVAVDHLEGDVFLLALHDSGEGEWEEGEEGQEQEGRGGTTCGRSSGEERSKVAAAEQEAGARAWLAETQAVVEAAAASGGRCTHQGSQPPSAAAAATSTSTADQPSNASSILPARAAPTAVSATTPLSATAPPAVVPFTLLHSRNAYIANIAACHAALHAGESYEVCLTTALARPAAPPAAELYRTLRRMNPAPYAAWLQCGAAGPTICCSSPERFLRGDRGGLLEARPIKGTAARVAGNAAADAAAAAHLAASEKERAENLMIVDLLRNDLGRVCEVGSVHVPGLMDIESYATVHQMVSTVRGVRRGGVSVIDCFRAAFPGGSMTGAPKVRTMQIIDSLEGRARGVYSGCVGFISLNDTFDLNIVIRTAVVEEGEAEEQQQQQQQGGQEAPGAVAAAACGGQRRQRRMTIGAGGAIVVQSEPEAEYDEMLLKASALLRAVGLCEGGAGPVPVVAE